MLQTLLSSLKGEASNDAQALSTNRRHPRRTVDRCVAVIHGRTFPVENWSLGGILIAADDRLFGKDQDIELTVKFRLRNTIIDVTLNGHVVRKSTGKIAVRFEPLSQFIRRRFQQVIDDSVAAEFANSQI